MDVTMMPFVAEAASPPPTPKASGKADTGEKEGSGFTAVFDGLMADAAPGDKGAKETADTDASAGDVPGTTPGVMGMVPGMWSFVPLMPTAMNAGQAQTATEGTGAIAPLTAAGTQVATRPDAARGQSFPGAQAAPPVTADADLVSQLPLPGRQQQAPPQGQQVQLPFPAQMPLQAQPQGQTQGTAPTAAATETPQQATTPVFTVDKAPAMPAMPVTKAALAAPQPAAEPVLAEIAPATAPATADASQTAATLTATTPTVVATAAKPPTANGDMRTANAPPADADAAGQTATQAKTVPTVSASAAKTGSDGDAALLADSFADDASLTAKADSPATTDTPVFAALVDQRTAPAATDAATAPTAQQPAGTDPYDVAGQIVDHARLIARADNSEMVIKLKPEHLGELTLKIAVENGTVSATFHTSSAEVRSAIEASLPQLRQDLSSQGLKVDNVGVYASLDQFFANDQRHAPQQQQLPTARRRDGDEVFAAEAITAAAPQTTLTASGGIDYRV